MVSTIKAISVSDRKGVRKNNIDSAELVVDFGLKNDAHGGKWHRQVSLLAQESIDFMRQKGLDVVAGNFAENLTTEGLDLSQLQVGTHIAIGKTELIISQLGKICHTRCAIYHQAGDCVMPREGIFAVVIKGGEIKVGDPIGVLPARSTSAAVVTSKAHQEAAEKLVTAAQKKFGAAFVRFDVLTEKEGGSLPAVLKDLSTTQQTADIVVYDPTGSLALQLIGITTGNSRLHHCRSIDEL